MSNKSQIPKFKNEDDEREFWSKHDLTEFYTQSDFVSVSFPDLKPTTRSVSVRIPEFILIRLKEQANELDIPYQTLMKQYIAKGVFRKQKDSEKVKS